MAADEHTTEPDLQALYESENPDDLFEFQERHMAPLFGFSADTIRLVDEIPEIAHSGLNVLVVGDTGTGKELVVRKLAEAARIPDGKLVSVNCAAIPRNLVESELFGYVAGAFTGANADKRGYFDEANGGAIFLDEIGELPRHTQAKLLRVIQEQEFFRVGGTKPVRVRVRLFAATSKLDRLREDIQWRFPRTVRLLPLAERLSDMFAILHGFLRRKLPGNEAEWSFRPHELLALLYSDWPGNVRELLNVAERAVAQWEFSGRPSRWVSLWSALMSSRGPVSMHIAREIWQAVRKAVWQMPGGRKVLPRHQGWQGPAMTLREVVNLFGFAGKHALDEATDGEPSDAPLIERFDDCVAHFIDYFGLPRSIPRGRRVASGSAKGLQWFEFGGTDSEPRAHGMGTGKEAEEVRQDAQLTDATFAEVEKRYFQELRGRYPTLTLAARAAGKSASTISEKLKKLGIPGYRGRPGRFVSENSNG
ncbi:MAG: sigma-54-dependent Fis family transcriptional regulator [Planctomycetes bacterium]|nr:sigma-54-dependent Fis family transcriptional regulator [Planctomycetota bacterium]